MKIVLANLDNRVIAVKDDDFVLADTATDLSVMPWTGSVPEIGTYYKDGKFVTMWQALSHDNKVDEVRKRRNSLLAETDWLVLRHEDQLRLKIITTLSDVQYNRLLSYRQALRDIVDTIGSTVDSVNSIDDISWPTKPDFI